MFCFYDYDGLFRLCIELRYIRRVLFLCRSIYDFRKKLWISRFFFIEINSVIRGLYIVNYSGRNFKIEGRVVKNIDVKVRVIFCFICNRIKYLLNL